MDTAKYMLQMSFIQFARYLLFAGGAYLVVCHFGARFFRKFRIQDKDISGKQALIEFKNSIITALIFGVILSVSINPAMRGHTKIYLDLHSHSMAWFWFSIVAMVFINDAYFYWMHRAIHHPKLFKLAHHTHHLSTNPSPLAAFSFHPIEAVLEAIWVIPVFMVMPIHPYALLIYSFISFLNNVIGHLSVELRPAWMETTFPFNMRNTATRHNQHHRHFNVNYGLYFLFWDKLCSTDKKLVG